MISYLTAAFLFFHNLFGSVKRCVFFILFLFSFTLGSVAVASLGPSLLPFSLPNVGSVKRCVFFILFLFSFTLPFPSSVFILSLVRWRSLKEQRVVIIGIHRTAHHQGPLRRRRQCPVKVIQQWKLTVVNHLPKDFLFINHRKTRDGIHERKASVVKGCYSDRRTKLS